MKIIARLYIPFNKEFAFDENTVHKIQCSFWLYFNLTEFHQFPNYTKL